jgi:uncharacterized protein YndB with AHSA1/START domain
METQSPRSVDHQYFVRAKPEEVFRAITDPKMLTRWLCDRAEISLKKGGQYLFAWADGPTHTGTVVDFEPGKRIGFAWMWPNVELTGTVFTLSVEAKDDGTELKVLHTGFPRLEQWTDLYGGAEWGWTYFAMNLKSVLETGRDLRSKVDG